MSGKVSKINHNAFLPYKNKFIQKNVVICGNGPSLNIYKPIPNAIHIGCNRCIYYDKFTFDIYFYNDWQKASKNYRKDILRYQPTIAKFFGVFPCQRSYGCNIQIAKEGKGLLYDIEGPGGCNGLSTYQKEIDTYYVGDYGMSIVFVLMQFALYTGCKNIYIVGCDITNIKDKDINNRYFINSKDIKNYSDHPDLLFKWLKMKNFISKHYNDVNIYTINPLGLKGYFEDIYQK